MIAAWAWALGWTAVVLFAALRSRRTGRDRSDGAAGSRPVRALLVRPCTGDDPRLVELLLSTAGATTRHRLEIVLSVTSAADPAHPRVVEAARLLATRGLAARAVIAESRGPNQKCGQLAAVIEGDPSEVVINADADVDLTGVCLDPLIDPLLAPGGPAATFAAPIEIGPVETPADRASAAVLDSSLHAFGLLAGLDPAGFVGKLFAARRSALDAIGGLGPLADFLGEDMELARRLRRQGLRTEAATMVARARPASRSWSQVIARYGRWITVIRGQRPALLASYPILFFPSIPLVALGVLGRSPALIALVLATRLLVALAARRASGRPAWPGLGRSIVVSDAVLALAFARALASPAVEWRGRRLRIGPGGKLSVAP